MNRMSRKETIRKERTRVQAVKGQVCQAAKSYPQGGASRVTRADEADAQPVEALWLGSTCEKTRRHKPRLPERREDLDGDASRVTRADEADVSPEDAERCLGTCVTARRLWQLSKRQVDRQAGTSCCARADETF